MSLVVGEIHDGGVSLVADTKVTHVHDGFRTRHVLENALPKLAILREDLCVGIAGNDPVGVISVLVARRDLSLDALTTLMIDMPHASFVVASLASTPALRLVRDGTVEDRTAVGRAWVGDHAGYEIFQARYGEWPPGMEPGFLLLSSLQWLLAWNPVPSIGGYHTRVATTSHGFCFVADVTNIGPEELRGLASAGEDGFTFQLTPPPGGDRSVLALQCAAGRAPTFGALAYFVAPLGLALLFSHDAPFEPIMFRASSIVELIDRAATEHGQRLVA